MISSTCFGCVNSTPDSTNNGDHDDTAFGSSANATLKEPDMSYALLDSGATHVILNLFKLTQEGQREGRSIGIRLAAGKQVGKIYQ
eukprot:2451123-Amphidinium_carterae.1